MAQLTPEQYRLILEIATNACGGSPAARARTLEFSTELTEGEWDHRTFFIRLANLLGPLPDTIPVFQVVGWQRIPIGNFRYKDAVALICARIMIRNIGRIPDPNVLIPLMAMFRPGLWNLVNIDRIGVQKVNGAEEEPPAPLEPPAVINIPQGQEDIITFEPIPDGTRMVDFHDERLKYNRYYTEETLKNLNGKNPYQHKPILPTDVTKYTARLDPTMPVQEAGRRRRKVTSKKAAKKTCASGYAVYNYRKTRKGVFYDCAPKRKTRRRHK